MQEKYYKNILVIIFGIITVFLLLSIIVLAINTWDTGYQVNHGNSVDLTVGSAGGSCYHVTNSDASNNYFVPTNTIAEWNAFVANRPAGVAIEECCSPVDATLSGWSACSASCGGGTQTRTCSGASCGGSTTCGGATLSQSCNTQVCSTYTWQVMTPGTCRFAGAIAHRICPSLLCSDKIGLSCSSPGTGTSCCIPGCGWGDPNNDIINVIKCQ